jgi:hypothetical protein
VLATFSSRQAFLNLRLTGLRMVEGAREPASVRRRIPTMGMSLTAMGYRLFARMTLVAGSAGPGSPQLPAGVPGTHGRLRGAGAAVLWRSWLRGGREGGGCG